MPMRQLSPARRSRALAGRSPYYSSQKHSSSTSNTLRFAFSATLSIAVLPRCGRSHCTSTMFPLLSRRFPLRLGARLAGLRPAESGTNLLPFSQ